MPPYGAPVCTGRGKVLLGRLPEKVTSNAASRRQTSPIQFSISLLMEKLKGGMSLISGKNIICQINNIECNK